MSNSLKEEIKKLNYDIENKTVVKPNRLTILPLLQNQSVKDTIDEDKLRELWDLN